MTLMKDLEQRVEILEARNKKVDADKAWETSWARRAAIAGLTYVTVVIYLRVVIHIDPWLNALVPVVGFILSTLTITYLKKIWLDNRK